MGLLSLCYSLSDVQIVVWANARVPYLRSRQGVQPLDRFIVGYEAVHPVHVQHYLTKSCRGVGDRKDYIRFQNFYNNHPVWQRAVFSSRKLADTT